MDRVYELTKKNITVLFIQDNSVEGDEHLPPAPKYITSPEDARIWNLGHNQVVLSRKPTKIYRVGIEVRKDNEVIARVIFQPYMIYEDFIGGQTTRNPENNIVSLLNFKIEKDKILITYIDGNQEKRKFIFNKI